MNLTAALSIATMSLTATALAIPAHAQEQTAAAARYHLTDLGLVGPSPGQPFHLTNNGLISGSAAYNGREQATLWYQLWKADIGLSDLGGGNSIAYGINDVGQAVGEADTAVTDPKGEDFCAFKFLGFHSGTTCLPALWQDGAVTALPTLQDNQGKRGNNGGVNAINHWGEAAGLAENTTLDKTCPAYDPSKGQTQKFQTKPVAWYQGKIYELPTLGGDPDGVALAMNDNGEIAGGSGECAALNQATFLYLQPVHAILWERGKPIDLGTLGGTTGSLATGVNKYGAVVGSANLAGDETTHGFLWTKETWKMRDLSPFSSDVLSVALAISDRFDITGVSIDDKGNPRAVEWVNGKAVDLNTRLADQTSLYLLLACGVNAGGEIIGLAVDTKTGATHGYQLTPVK